MHRRWPQGGLPFGLHTRPSHTLPALRAQLVTGGGLVWFIIMVAPNVPVVGCVFFLLFISPRNAEVENSSFSMCHGQLISVQELPVPK